MLRAAANSWLSGLVWWSKSAAAWCAGLLAIGVLVLLFFVRREYMPTAFFAILIGAVLVTGIQAARSPAFAINAPGLDQLRILQFDRQDLPSRLTESIDFAPCAFPVSIP